MRREAAVDRLLFRAADKFQERPANHLLGLVSGHGRKAWIDVSQRTVRRDDVDPGDFLLDQPAEFPFLLPQALFGALALGNVDHDGDRYRTAFKGRSRRVDQHLDPTAVPGAYRRLVLNKRDFARELRAKLLDDRRSLVLRHKIEKPPADQLRRRAVDQAGEVRVDIGDRPVVTDDRDAGDVLLDDPAEFRFALAYCLLCGLASADALLDCDDPFHRRGKTYQIALEHVVLGAGLQ